MATTINPAAVLALVGDLYDQLADASREIDAWKAEVARLQAALAEATGPRPEPPPEAGDGG